MPETSRAELMLLVLDELFRKLGHNEYAVGGGIGARGWDWGTAPLHELDGYVQFASEAHPTSGVILDVLTPAPFTPDPITNDYPTELPMSIPKGHAIEPLALQLEEELVLFPQALYESQGFRVRTQIVENEYRSTNPMVSRYDAYVPLDALLAKLDLVRSAGLRRFPL